MKPQSIYDNPIFFERYLQLRQNPISLNETIEKPTMFRLLPDLKGKKLCDLGCGTGEHLCHYAHLGATTLVGIDLSYSMLEQARLRLQQAGINSENFTLYQKPMEAFGDIAQQHFDVITSSYAFHYIEDFPALLASIHHKLAANGVLIFSQEHPIVTCHIEGERWEKDAQKQQVAYRLNEYRTEGERVRNWFKQPFKTYHRTMATLLNQLITAGFHIAEIAEPMLQDSPDLHHAFRDLRHRPPILCVKAVKKAS